MKYIRVLQPILFRDSVNAEAVGAVLEVDDGKAPEAEALVTSGYAAEATEADFKAYEKAAAKRKGLVNAPENKDEGNAAENKGGGGRQTGTASRSGR